MRDQKSSHSLLIPLARRIYLLIGATAVALIIVASCFFLLDKVAAQMKSMFAAPVVDDHKPLRTPPTGLPASSHTIGNLTALINGQDYATWFVTQTNKITDTVRFGAYAIEPDGSTLYLGFGASVPAHRDGALLAAYDTVNGLTVVDNLARTIDHNGNINDNGALNEQGFVDMHIAGGKVYLPGTDPCCGDHLSDSGSSGTYNHEWDWGNAYVYDPAGAFVKRRNMTTTLHTWGMWVDTSNNTLYAAASAHMGDMAPPDQIDENWSGRVFSSTNEAATWTLLADLDGSQLPGSIGQGDSVGNYRTYDIVGFNDALYIAWSDIVSDLFGKEIEQCGLAKSVDEGVTWNRFAALELLCRSRIELIDGQLVAAKAERDGLFRVDSSDQVTTVNFPDFLLKQLSYNFITADATDNIYVFSEDGRIMRSSDWVTWEPVFSWELELLEISYWPHTNQIIVADGGALGKVWTMATAVATITLPAVPTPTITISSNQLLLNMDTAADYAIYGSAIPYFMANQYLRYATVTADSTIDVSGIWLQNPAQNAFFRVREIGANGLSGQSTLVGAFDFALVSGS